MGLISELKSLIEIKERDASRMTVILPYTSMYGARYMSKKRYIVN